MVSIEIICYNGAIMDLVVADGDGCHGVLLLDHLSGGTRGRITNNCTNEKGIKG